MVRCVFLSGRIVRCSGCLVDPWQVNTLVTTSQLLVQTKRKELRHKARQRAKQDQTETKKDE